MILISPARVYAAVPRSQILRCVEALRSHHGAKKPPRPHRLEKYVDPKEPNGDPHEYRDWSTIQMLPLTQEPSRALSNLAPGWYPVEIKDDANETLVIGPEVPTLDVSLQLGNANQPVFLGHGTLDQHYKNKTGHNAAPLAAGAILITPEYDPRTGASPINPATGKPLTIVKVAGNGSGNYRLKNGQANLDYLVWRLIHEGAPMTPETRIRDYSAEPHTMAERHRENREHAIWSIQFKDHPFMGELENFRRRLSAVLPDPKTPYAVNEALLDELLRDYRSRVEIWDDAYGIRMLAWGTMPQMESHGVPKVVEALVRSERYTPADLERVVLEAIQHQEDLVHLSRALSESKDVRTALGAFKVFKTEVRQKVAKLTNEELQNEIKFWIRKEMARSGKKSHLPGLSKENPSSAQDLIDDLNKPIEQSKQFLMQVSGTLSNAITNYPQIVRDIPGNSPYDLLMRAGQATYPAALLDELRLRLGSGAWPAQLTPDARRQLAILDKHNPF